MSATATQTPAIANGAPEKPEGLAAKLVAAALAVESVEKRGKNKDQHYDYVMADDVAAAATRALLSFGVLCDFETVKAEQTPIQSRSGTNGLIVKATCKLIATDSETGEKITRTAIGYGSDYPGDKAIYKAMTGARKYAFIHLLGIPIGLDPEASLNGGDAAAPKRPATPQLDRQRVAALKAKIKDGKLKFKDLSLLLGSIGLDALRANSAKAVEERLRSLTAEQADQLEKLIDREGERDGS